MTYEEKIPDFALQPAKSEDADLDKQENNDEFDPTPYDRLLVPEPPEIKKENGDISEENNPTEEEKRKETVKEESEEKADPIIFGYVTTNS